MKKVESYAVGLIAEESGEVVQLCGKAIRFGIDTPHSVNGKRVSGIGNCRAALQKECGDIMAAIDYAIERGVLSETGVMEQRRLKLEKLLNPRSRDFLGRRLAP